MVKLRMSSTDVAAEVACLKRLLLGMRMANVYDLNAKTYMLKMAKSTGGESEKVLLLLESGSRFHTTQLMRDKSDIPSNFTLKLRKHIRTKRLEDVRQLGVDRIVDFVFGSGEAQYHLILEMYAQGNIVLCDSKYEVLTLLRSHRDDAKGYAVMARHPYPMDAIRLREAAQLEVMQAAYAAAAPGATIKSVLVALIPYGPALTEHCILDAGLNPSTKVAAGSTATSTATVAPPPPSCAGDEEAEGSEADTANAGMEAKAVSDSASPSATSVVPLSYEHLQALHAAVARLEDWFTGLEEGAAPSGYITSEPVKAVGGAGQQGGTKGKKQTKRQQQAQAQQQDAAEAPPSAVAGAVAGGSKAPTVVDSNSAGTAAATGDGSDGKGWAYQDFNPLRLHQSRAQHVTEYPTFDAALDEFFSKIEGQRAEQAQAEAEAQALGKLGRIRLDNDARAGALAKEAAEEDAKAQLIEMNLDIVDAAINAVNEALATGMDWRDLERMIKDERKAGNPVAACIASLQLEANCATLVLANMLDGEDEGDEEANTRRATKVIVDLSLNAYGNARAHFESRKRHAVKQAKTLAANEQALKAAEKKAQAQLLKVRATPAALGPARKPHWFERFHWFISSENYLVISGRDAQQNELIVKRYFRKGDAYVHAELHGASSTIVKNPTPDKPIPPMTLQQAGCACVCRSRAWDSKIITSAWWVQHHQVSKAAPTGEYLPTGSFMIRGKKSFLPPQPLVFGFGFMFKLEDSSIPAHLGERAVRGGDAESLAGAASLASWPEEPAGTSEDAIEVEAGSSGDEEAAADGKAATLPSSTPAARDALGAASRQASSTGVSSSQAASALDLFMEASADVSNYSRYGLAHPALADDEEPAIGSGSDALARTAAHAKLPGKRHLSAKERERLKKGLPSRAPAQQQQQQHTTAAEVAGGALNKPLHTNGADEEAAWVGAADGTRGAGGAGQSAKASTHGLGLPVQAVEGAQEAKGDAPIPGGAKAKQTKGKQATTAAAAAASAAATEARRAAAVVAQAGSQVPSRGRSSQAKKLRGKYADQDEEDRQMALQVLGSQGDKKTKSDRQKERKQRLEGKRQAGLSTSTGALNADAMKEAVGRAMRKEFERAPAAPGSDDDVASGSDSDTSTNSSRQGATTTNGGAAAQALEAGPGPMAPGGELRGNDEDVQITAPTSDDENRGARGSAAAASDGGGGPDRPNLARAQRRAAAAAATEVERAEIATLMAEEGVTELGDEERERLSALDALTGLPRPDDVLLFALPVCGPYQMMQTWKYKVKLTPGSVKKGKAARQITELLSRGPDVLPRERELLRACPDNDSAMSMVGTVKISMPGLQKLKASEKQGRRTAARAANAATAAAAAAGSSEVKAKVPA